MATRADYSSLDTPSASDWNTYILNGGLVYLAEYDLTSATQLDMNYAFSYPATQFRNYRVVISNLIGASAGSLYIKMMDGLSVWDDGTYLTAYSSARRQTTSASPTAVTNEVTSSEEYWVSVTIGTTTPAHLVFDIINPNHTSRTAFQGRGGILGDSLNTFAGQLSVSTVFSGISLTNSVGGNLSGNAQVYGYRTET
jgi:hypothetical protein